MENQTEGKDVKRQLDALVATAMGLRVLGWVPAMCPEGDWCLYPDEPVRGDAELQPVYLSLDHTPEEHERDCGPPKDDWWLTRLIFGHCRVHCEVVPFYSTSLEDAWAIIQFANGKLFSFRSAFFSAVERAVRMRTCQPVAWPELLGFLLPEDLCNALIWTNGATVDASFDTLPEVRVPH